MVDTQVFDALKRGQAEWNRWRAASGYRPVDLSGADLGGMKLNDFSLVRADLKGANLARAQLEHAHLKDADFTGAILTEANFEGANARDAVFDQVAAVKANFEVCTLRGARFRQATLTGARFHRAYLREADLSGADLSNAWLRFATLQDARCERTVFAGADMRFVAMVRANMKGADLTGVHVFGISAWNTLTDADTRQDLIIGMGEKPGDAPLRAHDLQTAQLLALMLDGSGVRRVLDSVNSKLVLILGSFGPEEKPALDALRRELQAQGYVAIMFDFERPPERDYAEAVLTIAGMSRFIVADFSNAKEVRAEVAQAHSQYKRVPIIPIARTGATLPITTLTNVFLPDELRGLVRYDDLADLSAKIRPAIIDPAEARVAQIAATIAASEALVRGL
jgi:uncharacterized protein YjbI with pentapeptide repeats